MDTKKTVSDGTDSVQLETSNEKKIALGEEENIGHGLAGASYTVAQTKKLLRKCDKHLLPFLALLYLLSFLDRTNIGNARLANLEPDLNMWGKWDYNVSF
jgi:hypothetical protein